CFFFSSRRRHTRSDRDWSSDVCSSDLWGGGLWLEGCGGVFCGAGLAGSGSGVGWTGAGAGAPPSSTERGAALCADMKARTREMRSEERRVGKEGRSGGAAGGQENREIG